MGERLIRTLAGVVDEAALPRLHGPTIIVAHDLSPADTTAMVDEPVSGFVTELGTRTSHTSIIARALEMPAVVGVNDVVRRIVTGDQVIVDGLRGVVIVRPTQGEIDDAWPAPPAIGFARELQEARDRAAATKCGVPIVLRANVELPARPSARDNGADGIGLYRTEFLYIDRALPPPRTSSTRSSAAWWRPWTPSRWCCAPSTSAATSSSPPSRCRGDEPHARLRAVRWPSRARTSSWSTCAPWCAPPRTGTAHMVPMVASLTELRQVRALLEQAHAEVRARGSVRRRDPLGVMIEVPRRR